ncbi:MAG: hypothetical protein KDD64_15340, partial [Bdellovibrionales bacterium]|nr:hypothetical protein [Bdellovibrionales bacterium]
MRFRFSKDPTRDGYLRGILALLVLLFVTRLPYLGSYTWINEDLSLELLARTSVQKHGLWYWFFHSYGPKVLRPFQLLGMYGDYLLFGTNLTGRYLHSLVVLFLGLALILAVVQRMVPGILAFFVVAPLALSRGLAEPLFWLSDRHDLYLLMFFGASLFCAEKFLLPFQDKGYTARWGVLLVLCWWGSFFSNEKGLVVPLLSLLLASAFRGSSWKMSLLAGVAAAVVSWVLYFALRLSAVGTFIGGYDDSIFPFSG